MPLLEDTAVPLFGGMKARYLPELHGHLQELNVARLSYRLNGLLTVFGQWATLDPLQDAMGILLDFGMCGVLALTLALFESHGQTISRKWSVKQTLGFLYHEVVDVWPQDGDFLLALVRSYWVVRVEEDYLRLKQEHLANKNF